MFLAHIACIFNLAYSAPWTLPFLHTRQSSPRLVMTLSNRTKIVSPQWRPRIPLCGCELSTHRHNVLHGRHQKPWSYNISLPPCSLLKHANMAHFEGERPLLLELNQQAHGANQAGVQRRANHCAPEAGRRKIAPQQTQPPRLQTPSHQGYGASSQQRYLGQLIRHATPCGDFDAP